MKNIYSFLFLLFVTSLLNAQSISGVVTDNNGLYLPGVNVVSKATGKSTTTDFDGKFSILVSENELLKFSFIGYESVSIRASLSEMKIVLEEYNTTLSEVVVVGYGTKKLGSITGSVSQIKSADILKNPGQSAIQSIQGKAAGVNIVTNDEPGANPSIIIRGLGTVLGARNPLYVIDGVESTSLNGLSANDIASLDILKDASSLAIYGQKGANGVVIVTTKKGKKGKVTISYDAFYGQKDILKKVKMADSYRYAYYNNAALGSSSFYNFNQPVNTNWLDEITRKGKVTNNAISISGANDMVNYYLGISNYTEKGILLGTEFKRNNIVNKNEYKFSEKLKITQFVSLSIANNTPKPLSAFTNAYKQSPIVPVRYANGRFGSPLVNTATGLNDITGQVMNNVANPVAQLYNTYEKNKNVTLFGSLGAELKLLNDLKFNTSFGATADWAKGYTFTPNRELWLTQNPSLSSADYSIQRPKDPINTLQQRRSDSYIWNWDNYFTYKKDFGLHNFTVVAGMSRTTSNNSEVLNGTRLNVPDQTNYWYLDISNQNNTVAPGSVVTNNHSNPRVSIAYFGRLEYEYNNKYLLSGSIRREGISVFQSDKKWGVFPALSAGWIVSNEDFLKDIKIINALKLRAGYGEVGNGNGPSFNNITFSNIQYPFGINPVSQPGNYVRNDVDPNLTWETMKEFDFGLDFTILNNHLTGTIDYYNRKADDIILPLSIPKVLSEENVFINSGVVTNKGLELTLRYDNKIGANWRYYVGGNFSTNTNEVSEITSPYFKNLPGSGSTNNGEYTKLVKLGAPLGSFYVFDLMGYNSDGEPILDDMVDGIAGLTDNDRINAGSYIPTFTYGLNLGLNYKNFDFSVDTYGVGGNKIYNGKKAQRFVGENVESAVLDNFWTPSNPNALNPKPFNAVPRPSTYYIEDGSYLRINNITLGYTVAKMINTIDKIRIYATATNPFIFTNYSGFSPEISGGDNGNPLQGAGIELDAYPTNKTILFGLNVSF